MDPLAYEMIDVGDGVTLEVSITNRGGERGLALLLHGFPELAFSWRFQIDLLAAMGYEVWAPNTRGYGQSSKPRKVAAYRTDLLLQDIAALIDRSGRDRVTLIGHDWGAAQAWLFAARKVRPLERLVIMNVPHPECMRRELRSFRQLRKSWYIFFFQIPWLPQKLMTLRGAKAIGDAFTKMAVDTTRFPSEVTDVYRQAALRPNTMRSMINYYRAAVRGLRADSRASMAIIEAPTLMLWGLEDTALSKQTTEGTDAYVADLTLRYLPGVSHWVQQEAPETVNAMLSAWLHDLPVPEAADIGVDVVVERLADPALDNTSTT